MGSITQQQYLEMLQRTGKHQQWDGNDGVEIESDLHNEIIKHCRNRGWIYFHGSMATKTHRTKGEPDFTILADSGRWFAIEAKSKTGKLSTDQLALIMQAQALGHVIHTVANYAQFLEVVK